MTWSNNKALQELDSYCDKLSKPVAEIIRSYISKANEEFDEFISELSNITIGKCYDKNNEIIEIGDVITNKSHTDVDDDEVTAATVIGYGLDHIGNQIAFIEGQDSNIFMCYPSVWEIVKEPTIEDRIHELVKTEVAKAAECWAHGKSYLVDIQQVKNLADTLEYKDETDE